MKLPANIKFTEEHEWVVIEGDIATIGITILHNNNLAISYL